MAITAKSILQQVIVTLNDQGLVHFKLPELCRHFNDGQREIARLRPDLVAEPLSLTLTPGARQSLPATHFRLMDVERNSAAPKRAVTQCKRKVLDLQVPGWEGMTPAREIRHFTYEADEPTSFHVYPPATSDASLEIVAARYPLGIDETTATVAAVTGTMDLPDGMTTALQHYITAMAFDKDGQHPANAKRAADHLALFAQAVSPAVPGEGGLKQMAEQEARA